MSYLLCFLEGIITFLSPCMLPMLPLYVFYFAGTTGVRRRAFTNSLGFVLGFTLVFVAMGGFAGTVGGFLTRHVFWLNLVTGGLVVVLGLQYVGILKLPFLNLTRRMELPPEKLKQLDFATSVLFGLAFSVGYTPCVGAFLGSALSKAASAAHSLDGIVLLLCYSLGLGIPFIISAVLIEKLTVVFDFIKRHYRAVNLVSGVLLIATGVAIMTGWMGELQGSLNW